MEHLTDLQIDAYCNNELNQDESKIVAEHIKICPSCQQKVIQAQAFEELLSQAVSKTPPPDKLPTDHLSDEKIAGYIEQTLDPKEREEVESHLSQCHLCLLTLIEANKYFWSDLEAAEPKGLVASLTKNVLKMLSPAKDRAILAKDKTIPLWKKTTEGNNLLSERIKVTFDRAKKILSLLLPPGIEPAPLPELAIRNREAIAPQLVKIPLPNRVGSLTITFQPGKLEEIEATIQPVIEKMPAENIIVSLSEESGRLLRSQAVANKTAVRFSIKPIPYFITIECLQEKFMIPLITNIIVF